MWTILIQFLNIILILILLDKKTNYGYKVVKDLQNKIKKLIIKISSVIKTRILEEEKKRFWS